MEKTNFIMPSNKHGFKMETSKIGKTEKAEIFRNSLNGQKIKIINAVKLKFSGCTHHLGTNE